MKIFWWQGGVHIDPENQEEREALIVLLDNLKILDVKEIIPTPPLIRVQGSN